MMERRQEVGFNFSTPNTGNLVDQGAQRRGSGGADERSEEGTEQRSCSALPCNRLLGVTFGSLDYLVRANHY
jgi:hypothetical protein